MNLHLTRCSLPTDRFDVAIITVYCLSTWILSTDTATEESSAQINNCKSKQGFQNVCFLVVFKLETQPDQLPFEGETVHLGLQYTNIIHATEIYI